MWGELFLKGCFLGICIAMPVGPIGILCVEYSLVYGRQSGLVAGLGAAAADTLYGILAGFGISALSLYLFNELAWIQLVGAVFLILLGLSAFKKSASARAYVKAHSISLMRIFCTTFFLTLTNPLTLLCFAAIYAGLGITTCDHGLWTPIIFSAGIFVGSTLWWLALSYGVSLAIKSPSEPFVRYLQMASGTILIAFGVIATLGYLRCF